jgi:ribonucleoside-diphosphate reductase alpha chain
MEKRKRPSATMSFTDRVITGCGKVYITPGWDPKDNFLIEVFATLGKSGGCAYAHLEALTRAISLGLKFGVPLEEYIKELENIRCPSPLTTEGVEILSCPDAVAKVLGKVKEKSSNGHRIDIPDKIS